MSILAQHSSVRNRLSVLRHARLTEIWRLAPYSFAPILHPIEALRCELLKVEDYDSALVRLSSYVGRSSNDIRPVDRKSLERLLAAAGTSSGAIGIGDLLFLHAFITTLARGAWSNSEH